MLLVMVISQVSGARKKQIPDYLRGGIECSEQTINKAVEMYNQGWRYTMPKPKNKKANWHNNNFRSKWYYGYWHNIKTNKYSSATPVKNNKGEFVGNDTDLHDGFWRKGGAPKRPSKLQWLLSSAWGIEPED